MNFKQLTIVAAAATSILGIATTASADLTIFNNTTSYNSAVKVGSTCSASLSLYTKPGEHKNIPGWAIGTLCFGSNPCKAEVYMVPTSKPVTCDAQYDITTANYHTDTGAIDIASNAKGFGFIARTNNLEIDKTSA